MEIKVLGHATVLITNSKTIYIDPYKGDFPKKADIILVSHSHYDHLDITKINEIKTENTKIFTSKEASSKILGSISMSPGDRQVIDGIIIEAVEAYNIDKKFHPKGFGIGFIITIENKRIYFAGDTDFIPEMKTFENIDYALLPIGGTYTMDEQEAVKAAIAIKPKVIIPIHYGTSAKVPLAGDPNKLKKLIEEKQLGISVETL